VSLPLRLPQSRLLTLLALFSSANVVKRLLALDERLKAAFRAGLNHARLRTLAGFGDVFVELPAAIGGIKARATKA